MPARRTAILLPLAASADDSEVSLFDGASTAGWLSVTGDPFPQRSWRIEDGCLKTNPPRPGAMQDLRTEGEFAFFDLFFEWKIAPGGNSGVKYSLADISSFKPKDDPEGTTGLDGRARGLEFQLGDASTPDVQRGPQYAGGALYGICAPTSAAKVRQGEFNTGRIVYSETRLEHWINGTLLLSLNPSSEDFAGRVRAASRDPRLLARRAQSPIALQYHASEVWFRNLRVRRLSAVTAK